MRRALILAFLLVLLSLILGATTFREPVAWAAGVINVNITNVDRNGNVKVHERGTANVNVVRWARKPITGGGFAIAVSCPAQVSDFQRVTTSAISIYMAPGVYEVDLMFGSAPAARFLGPASGGNPRIDFALMRPIRFTSIRCLARSRGEIASVSTVGNLP